MTARSVATVFGGSGFIGRYVVKRLARAGHIVRVAVRDPEAALFLKPMGAVGQIVPLFADLRQEATVARAVDGAAFVINAVGILTEARAGDFARIQGEGAARIARLAAAAGARAMVHISAIGADAASPSHYAASKAQGEQGVQAAFPSAVILRPSVVFGPEDEFYNRFAAMAQVLPFLPVISGATQLQPVYVGDVADAVIAALSLPASAPRIYELGGPDIWTMRQIMEWILHHIGRHRRLVEVPEGLARLQASVLEKLPGKLLTRDQLLLLQRHNVVSPDMPGLAQLGIAATPADLVVPAYLRRYCPGGKRPGGVAEDMAESDLSKAG
ncbi:MAG: complex I NDUFA9 subunit family protein [Proteobacteria bacterium]|nr:complex I NDUFA9 subunit family protein [Pseudomonadota bacterium]